MTDRCRCRQPSPSEEDGGKDRTGRERVVVVCEDCGRQLARGWEKGRMDA